MHDAVNLVYKKNIRHEGEDSGQVNDGLVVLTLEANCYAVFFERYEKDEDGDDFNTRRGLIAIFKRHERDRAQEYAVDAGRKSIEELKKLPWLEYQA